MLIPTLISVLAMPHLGGSWHIEGTLSEACTCAVPCPCNFGDAPSHHFCYAIVAMHIDKGDYAGRSLDGLELGGANGAKGYVFYIDDRADADQENVLRQIATDMFTKALRANGVTDPSKAPPDFRLAGFKRAKITQEIGEKSNNIKLGNMGGFASTYIVGIDGKTPVRVMNNASFNFKDGGIKGKTKFLKYKDSFGNQFDFNATNANQGRFDWSNKTPVYFK